ncbi:MAG: S8 family peptidase [Propionibacteriaceae bacterium]|nr:S8 family peptidase [Propionibacteriaceae bacterium]
MTVEHRPLLAFEPPVVGARPSQKPRNLPRLSKPGAGRQGERLTPQFKDLTEAFAAERARLRADIPDEIDPALVVVFDLAGSVKDFCNAINHVEGMEFLSELLGDHSDPDDDFHMTESDSGRMSEPVKHWLYLAMSNSKAIDELLRLFGLWQSDPSAPFEHGLGKFKAAFEQLTAIRRWSAEDRIRETGLRERWEETLSLVGQSISPVLVEVELWHRRESEQRAAAEAHVQRIITSSGGRVLDRSQIAEIEYHALLVELPIQQVQSVLANGAEAIRLLTDLLHRAIKRIVDGDGNQPAAAPNVRVVNLSIGAQVRALTRRMSPVGRLLDWLAHAYNLLFVVSAGNHTDEFSIPAEAARDADTARLAAARAVFDSALLRGILPPGDALNALTVGATHSDALGEIAVPDTAWDITDPDAPALYGAIGPGVDRSIKPDIHHIGGRALYTRPVFLPGQTETPIRVASSAVGGPGLQVAAPGRGGATNSTVFTHGTSNATALVTREASRVFDILEAENPDPADAPLPDPQYHPLLVRALLAHASTWGTWEETLRRDLGLSGQDARRQLTARLGYGRLDVTRLAAAATNRAVLIAGSHIKRNERHTYEFPLPPSLHAKAEWHRFTITLAFTAPTVGQLTRYRSAKVYFATPDKSLLSGERSEAEHNAVRRGSLQHEIVQGSRAMSIVDGDSFPIHVECMDDAQRLRAGHAIRYALVVSVETAEQTSNTIHDEVRDRLRARVRAQGRIQT